MDVYIKCKDQSKDKAVISVVVVVVVVFCGCTSTFQRLIVNLCYKNKITLIVAS